jgi:hypothetical protein
MRAFEISLNDQKLCVAGIGEEGVLTSILTSVARKNAGDLFLQVGGLINPTRQHVDWVSQKPLKVGDKVQIRVVEADAVDEPATRNSDNRETDLEARKSHVRNLASQLGWKIQENS